MTSHDTTAATQGPTEPSPLSASMALEVIAVATNHTALRMSGSTWPLNPNGALHGGIVTAAAERSATIAVQHHLDSIRPRTATSISMAFLRPAIPPIQLDATLHQGDGDTQFVTVVLTASDGRICATALTTVAPAGPEGQALPGSDNEDGKPGIVNTTRADLIQEPVDGGHAEWRAWVESLPASRAMGMRCLHASGETARILIPAQASETGLAVPHGMVAAWADHCFGIVATLATPTGASPATATLSAQFLRPAHPPLTFDATARKAGHTLAFVDVVVRDAAARAVAIVTGSMSVDGTSRFLGPAS